MTALGTIGVHSHPARAEFHIGYGYSGIGSGTPTQATTSLGGRYDVIFTRGGYAGMTSVLPLLVDAFTSRRFLVAVDDGELFRGGDTGRDRAIFFDEGGETT